VAHVLETVQTVCQKRNIEHSIQMVNADPPAQSAPQVLDAIRASVAQMQVSSLEMVSRAYHDSLFMARVFPTAMIFIPCRGGVSHRPDEYAAPKDIATGVEVLARTMLNLANA
jgi:ureidoglycolate amidohydrolase